MNDENYTVKDTDQWDSAVNSLCGEHSISIDMSAGPDYTAIATVQNTQSDDLISLTYRLNQMWRDDTRSMAERIDAKIRAALCMQKQRERIIKDDRVQRLILALEHEATNPEYLSMYCDWLTEQLRLPSGLDEPITEEWLQQVATVTYNSVPIYTFQFDSFVVITITMSANMEYEVYLKSQTIRGLKTRRHVVNLCEALLMKPWAEIVASNKKS